MCIDLLTELSVYVCLQITRIIIVCLFAYCRHYQCCCVLAYKWEVHGVGNINTFWIVFKTRIRDIYVQDWSSEI